MMNPERERILQFVVAFWLTWMLVLFIYIGVKMRKRIRLAIALIEEGSR